MFSSHLPLTQPIAPSSPFSEKHKVQESTAKRGCVAVDVKERRWSLKSAVGYFDKEQ